MLTLLFIGESASILSQFIIILEMNQNQNKLALEQYNRITEQK